MNILDVIKRVKISCGYSSDAELSRALNMSPQNFLSQKKTGKIKDSLMVHAIERGVNIDWIKTGQGNMMAAHEVVNHIKESQAPYNGAAFANHLPSQSKPLLELTADVLSTDSVYRSALESNVKAFHDAVSARKQLAIAEAKLAQCQRDTIELKQELNEKDLLIEKLQAVISELRAAKSGTGGT
jgi:hypothetical protein